MYNIIICHDLALLLTVSKSIYLIHFCLIDACLSFIQYNFHDPIFLEKSHVRIFKTILFRPRGYVFILFIIWTFTL